MSNVVINETLARRAFGGDDPIGRRIGRSTVVGVAADVPQTLGRKKSRTRSSTRSEKPQGPEWRGVAIPPGPGGRPRSSAPGSTSGSPNRASGEAFMKSTQACRSNWRTMEAQIGHFYTPRYGLQNHNQLFLFALIGLFLAGIGIYGPHRIPRKAEQIPRAECVTCARATGGVDLTFGSLQTAARWRFVGQFHCGFVGCFLFFSSTPAGIGLLCGVRAPSDLQGPAVAVLISFRPSLPSLAAWRIPAQPSGAHRPNGVPAP